MTHNPVKIKPWNHQLIRGQNPLKCVINPGYLLHSPGDPASQIDFERRGHTAECQEIKERVDEHGQAPHDNGKGHITEEG